MTPSYEAGKPDPTAAPISLRRVGALPPYAIGGAAPPDPHGREVIDLGFGNPDLPSPAVAVELLATEARDPLAHRYVPGVGRREARTALSELYRRRFGIDLDPDSEVVLTVGAKQGIAQLLTATVEAGDSVLVPTPAYPSHRYAPRIAGAAVVEVPLTDQDGEPDPEGFLDRLRDAWTTARPRPRVLLLSFPHNPTSAVVDHQWWQRVVEFAHQHGVLIVHDFAYGDTAFDGYQPPSVLEVPGAREVAVEVYSLTKSFSMAGWRVAFVVGNPGVLQGLSRLKAYQDYGVFAPVQMAAAAAMTDAPDYPARLSRIYQQRRDVLCEELRQIGWAVRRPPATMFVWAPVPPALDHLDSEELSGQLLRRCAVNALPGAGLGPGGNRHVRFALVADVPRLRDAAQRCAALIGPSALADTSVV